MNFGRSVPSIPSLPSSPSSKRNIASNKFSKKTTLLPRSVVEEFSKVLVDDWITKAIDVAEIHDFTIQTFQSHFEGAAAIRQLMLEAPSLLRVPEMLDVEPITLAFENWNRNSVSVMQKTSTKASISFQDVSILSLTQKSKGRNTNTPLHPNQISNASLKRTQKDNINEESTIYSKSRRSSYNPMISTKENNSLVNQRKQPSVIKLLPAQSSLSLNARLNEEDLRTKKLAEVLRFEKKEPKIRVKMENEPKDQRKVTKEKPEAFQIKKEIVTYTLNGEPFVIKPHKPDNVKSLIQHPK